MTDSLSGRVVTAVAEANGVDHTELPPLYSVVDPDALEALFDGRREESGSDCQLSFTYAGQEVRIRNGRLTVGGVDRPSSEPPGE
jgi:hypothetical protein